MKYHDRWKKQIQLIECFYDYDLVDNNMSHIMELDLPSPPLSILSLSTKSWLILVSRTAKTRDKTCQSELVESSNIKHQMRSNRLTQHFLLQTNLRPSVIFKAAGTKIKVGFHMGVVALSKDGPLEAFVARVFGMHDKLDAADAAIMMMMFPRRRRRRVVGRTHS